MIQLRYFGRSKSLTQGTPQDASVKCPTRLRNSQKRSKNPWRLRECAMEEPSINKLHEQSILLREGRDWGLFHPSETKSSRKGGKDLQTADRKPRVPSEKKERFASLQIPSHQRGRKIFFQKTKWTDGEPYLIIIGSVIPKKWWRIKNWTRGTADMR